MRNLFQIINWFFIIPLLFITVSCFGQEVANKETVSTMYQIAKEKASENKIEESIKLCEDGLREAVIPDYLRAKFYKLLFYNHMKKGDLEQALDYCNIVIESFRKEEQILHKVECLEMLAQVHLNNGALEKEREILDQSLALIEQIDHPAKTFNIKNRIGLNYYYTGEYESAIQYFIKNAKALENHDSLALQKINSYRSMGMIHSAMEQNDEAIEFYNKAINEAKKFELESRLPITYYNIGLIYISEEEFVDAENSLNEGLRIAKKIGDKTEEAYINLALADMFSASNNFKKAKDHGHLALEFFAKKNFLIDEGQTYGLLGKVYLMNNEVTKAFQYFKIAEKIFVRADNKALRLELFAQLSLAYAKIGDYKSAFEYNVKQTTLEKELSSIEKDKAVIALQTEFESEFKSKEQEFKIATLEKETILKKQQFYLVIGIGFLLFLTTALLWRSYSLKKRQNVILFSAKELAEKAAKTNFDFLATMSHEIRTPLNGVVGMANILSKEDLSANQKKHVDVLKFSADGLLNLINDILDYTKFESGKIELEKNEFNLNEYCSNAFGAYKNGTRDSKVKIHLEMNIDQLKNNVIGDQHRFNQVMTNLANNAMKFTKEGRVDVKINITEMNNTNVKLMFEVIDSGIGISKEKQKCIFEKFTQANSNTTRLYGGTGLGLNISKEIVELYGSELMLESELGKGSRFYFVLDFPLGKPIVGGSNRPQIATTERLDLAGLKVLLAEDNEVNQLVAKLLLEKWNVNLVIAENGQVAIDKFKSMNFDVILMDIQMPVLDGFEATRIIRGLPNGTLPIYSMTASTLNSEANNEDVKLMDGHINKPFNPNDLHAILVSHYKGSRSTSRR